MARKREQASAASKSEQAPPDERPDEQPQAETMN